MPSKTLRIGVAACFMYPDNTRKIFEKKSLCYLEKDMARYLSRDDVMPVLIPDLEGKQLEKFLGELSGFVFQGGSDIAPQTYGEEPISAKQWPGDPYRDQFELKIMKFAMERQKPVLGICRGFQLMNVYFGGSLYQDIQTQHPEARQHRDGDLYDQLHHEIELVSGGLLEKFYQNTSLRTVNSVHHQGVKGLGKDLEVLAWSVPDKIVEAFQWRGAPEGKVMGVQWHPEFFYNSQTPLLEEQCLYDHFLSFCR